MSLPGQIAVPLDEQRAQVARKMHFDLYLGLRGILGPDVNDEQKRLAEATAIMTVLQQQINESTNAP